MKEYAVMPKEEYVAQCEWIRERLGIENKIKSGEILSLLKEVVSFTDDANATAEDIVNGKTSWVKGKKVTGKVIELKGRTYSSPTLALDNDKIKMSVVQSVDILVRSGAVINMVSALSNFGNATTDEVVAGRTITSAAGLCVKGTGQLVPAELYGSYVLSDEPTMVPEGVVDSINTSSSQVYGYFYDGNEYACEQVGEIACNYSFIAILSASSEKGIIFQNKGWYARVGTSKYPFPDSRYKIIEFSEKLPVLMANYKTFMGFCDGSDSMPFNIGHEIGFEEGEVEGKRYLSGTYTLREEMSAENFSDSILEYYPTPELSSAFFLTEDGWKEDWISRILMGETIKIYNSDQSCYIRADADNGWTSSIGEDFPDSRYLILNFEGSEEAPKDFYNRFINITVAEGCPPYYIGYSVGRGDGMNAGGDTDYPNAEDYTF